MTIAFWCVLAAGLMPFVWTAAAKFSTGEFGARENLNPREYKETLTGVRRRAVWAEQNAFEAFPFFAASVIIATMAGAPAGRIDLLAGVYIVLRILHGVFYLLNQGLARSLVWFSSVGCVIALFVAGA